MLAAEASPTRVLVVAMARPTAAMVMPVSAPETPSSAVVMSNARSDQYSCITRVVSYWAKATCTAAWAALSRATQPRRAERSAGPTATPMSS